MAVPTKISLHEFATEHFIRKFHQNMFNKTWRWAGHFRNSDKNIGVCWTQISTKLHLLCGDLIYQVNCNSYSIEEIAIRFHHRLVSIHPFPNGNGRLARMMTDHLLRLLGHPKFTWGQRDLTSATQTRKRYIAALKKADVGILEPLLAFAQSE